MKDSVQDKIREAIERSERSGYALPETGETPELVDKEYEVKSVLSESYQVSITPQSEQVFGPGPSPSYGAGMGNRMLIEVLDGEGRAGKLLFQGYSPVRGGDKIHAKVIEAPQAGMEGLPKALEIRVLGGGRTDRAAGYGRFIGDGK